MKQQLEEEVELRRYLLGELALEERVAVEERLFLDDGYTRLAQSVEDELVDEYAHQDLTGDERERFESHFLATPEHRDDLHIAQALKRYIDSETGSGLTTPAPVVVSPVRGHGGVPRIDKERGLSFFPSFFAHRPAVGLSLAAALLITLTLVVWLTIRPMRSPGGGGAPLQAQGPAPTETAPPEQQGAPGGGLPANSSNAGSVETAKQQGGNETRADVKSRPEDEQAARHSARPRRPAPMLHPAPTGVATFTILPGGIGRDAGQTGGISFAHDVGTVILKLPITAAEDYDGYRATLRTGGRAKYTWPALKSETDDELGKIVSLTVPVRLLLRSRVYEIKLGGLNAERQSRYITTYSFRVDNK
jgi:hypothetical protein